MWLHVIKLTNLNRGFYDEIRNRVVLILYKSGIFVFALKNFIGSGTWFCCHCHKTNRNCIFNIKITNKTTQKENNKLKVQQEKILENCQQT